MWTKKLLLVAGAVVGAAICASSGIAEEKPTKPKFERFACEKAVFREVKACAPVAVNAWKAARTGDARAVDNVARSAQKCWTAHKEANSVCNRRKR